MLQLLTHFSLHILVPGLIAWCFFRENWPKVWLLLLATMLIDMDHFLADPIYDPRRCSVGFHYLHQWFLVPIYVAMIGWKKTRIVGIGLTLHLFTDSIDCIWNCAKCAECAAQKMGLDWLVNGFGCP